MIKMGMDTYLEEKSFERLMKQRGWNETERVKKIKHKRKVGSAGWSRDKKKVTGNTVNFDFNIFDHHGI